MFEYILAGFTGTFFSYWVVFNAGGCTFQLFVNHEKENEKKIIDKYFSDMKSMQYRLDDMSCILNKLNNTKKNSEDTSSKCNNILYNELPHNAISSRILSYSNPNLKQPANYTEIVNNLAPSHFFSCDSPPNPKVDPVPYNVSIHNDASSNYVSTCNGITTITPIPYIPHNDFMTHSQVPYIPHNEANVYDMSSNHVPPYYGSNTNEHVSNETPHEQVNGSDTSMNYAS